MANNYPSQYEGIVNQAVQGTGLPKSVVVAQVNEESGFNPTAVSPAGAQGMFQFMPGTLASTGGGNPFDPAQEVHNYITYMNQLLKQEGGSIFKALEAYNAGPGNLQAGAGYANTILRNAGQPTGATAGGGSGGGGGTPATTAASLTLPFPGGTADPLNWPFQIGGAAANAAGQGIVGGATSLGEAFFQAIGVTSVKDFLIRTGLILFGGILVIVGIMKLVDMGKAAETAGAGITLVNPEAGLATMNAGRSVSRSGVRGGAHHVARTRARKLTSQSPEGRKAASEPLTGAGDADRQIEKSGKELAQ